MIRRVKNCLRTPLSAFHRGRDERGQGAVEFALVAGIFFLMVAAGTDVGRGVWTYGTLQDAVRQASRYAVVHGSASDSPIGPGDTSRITGIVDRFAANAANPAGVIVTVTYPDGGNKPGDRVVVSATLAFKPAMGFGFGPFTLDASSTRNIIH